MANWPLLKFSYGIQTQKTFDVGDRRKMDGHSVGLKAELPRKSFRNGFGQRDPGITGAQAVRADRPEKCIRTDGRDVSQCHDNNLMVEVLYGSTRYDWGSTVLMFYRRHFWRVEQRTATSQIMDLSMIYTIYVVFYQFRIYGEDHWSRSLVKI